MAHFRSTALARRTVIRGSDTAKGDRRKVPGFGKGQQAPGVMHDNATQEGRLAIEQPGFKPADFFDAAGVSANFPLFA